MNLVSKYEAFFKLGFESLATFVYWFVLLLAVVTADFDFTDLKSVSKK